jgi:hypothetical protein
VEDLYNYKRLVGELLGAAIAVIWICYALLGLGNMVFLVVALSLTILLGTLSGGFIALNIKKNDYKEIVGWLLGAVKAIVYLKYIKLEDSL